MFHGDVLHTSYMVELGASNNKVSIMYIYGCLVHIISFVLKILGFMCHV